MIRISLFEIHLARFFPVMCTVAGMEKTFGLEIKEGHFGQMGGHLELTTETNVSSIVRLLTEGPLRACQGTQILRLMDDAEVGG